MVTFTVEVMHSIRSAHHAPFLPSIDIPCTRDLKTMSQENQESPREFGIVELESVLARLGRALRKIKIPSALLSKDIDINSFWQLSPLRDNPVLRPTELAQQLGLDNSTVSRQLQKLEALKLVERKEDPSDARAHLIALTPDGRHILDVVAGARREKIASVLSHWNHDEILSLIFQLARLSDELEIGSKERP